MTEAVSPGTLYVVSTPIGNLGDMTFRAVEILRSVSFILAEDTRTFGKLAAHFSIKTPALSCYEQNERARAEELVTRLRANETAALVSEAGTPCISDPGYRIVSAARAAQLEVRSVPGACAAIAALSISGFPSDRFLFIGFLPQKSGKRRTALVEALASPATVVLYESPYRVVKLLKELESLAPGVRVLLAREITKMYEESIEGTAEELRIQLEAKSKLKGEFVLLVHPQRDAP